MISRNPATSRTVAYVGPFSFPEGGAAARRILGNALALRDAGYKVLIGSGQLAGDRNQEPTEYQGLSVYSLGERTAESYPILLKHLAYARMGKKTCRWLGELESKPRAVILYGGYTPYLMHLLRWCKESEVPVVFDAVEWYDSRNMPGGRYSPYRWSFDFFMWYLSPKAGNIIAISSYLENYYQRRGCNTLLVPPTLDTQAVKASLQLDSGGVLTLGYTGSPGKKDLLDNALEAVLQLLEEGLNLRFRIAGVTLHQLLALPSMRRRGVVAIPPGIEVLGEISQADAISMIGQVDYSVLLRPPLRYAQAGFPTKVVESLAAGTPVMCNNIGDLGHYIQDEVEGIICHDHTPESLVEVIRRAYTLTKQQRLQMRASARMKAERAFDFRTQVIPFAGFIESLRIGKG